MRAVVIDEFGVPPAVRDVPEPACPPDGVIVRVEATGLCRSDWHGWMGHDADIRLPHVPGHEFAGVIAQTGGAVNRWHVGDRVTAPFVCACGACPTCRRGEHQVCDNQQQPGFHALGIIRRTGRRGRRRRQRGGPARRPRFRHRGEPGLPVRHRVPRGRAPRPARRPAVGLPSTAAAVSGCPR